MKFRDLLFERTNGKGAQAGTRWLVKIGDAEPFVVEAYHAHAAVARVMREYGLEFSRMAQSGNGNIEVTKERQWVR